MCVWGAFYTSHMPIRASWKRKKTKRLGRPAKAARRDFSLPLSDRFESPPPLPPSLTALRFLLSPKPSLRCYLWKKVREQAELLEDTKKGKETKETNDSLRIAYARLKRFRVALSRLVDYPRRVDQ